MRLILALLLCIASSANAAWFNVVDYGATGDGTTDDTAAINGAIAALNASGAGVLYLPAGSYATTGGLTPISVGGIVQGDGATRGVPITSPATLIKSSSPTNTLFTITSDRVVFRDLAITNNAASTPTAGSAITVLGTGDVRTRVDYENIYVERFYNNIDIGVSNTWTMRSSAIGGAVNYGIRIRNTVNSDSGDWSISDSVFSSTYYNGVAAIRIESSGGGKIINTKINGGAQRWRRGIDVAPSGVTSILLISNNSIENTSGDGIHISNSGTWSMIGINGNQFGLYSSANAAINIAGQQSISITGNLITGSGGPNAVILDGDSGVRLVDNVYVNYTNAVSATNVSDIVDLDHDFSTLAATLQDSVLPNVIAAGTCSGCDLTYDSKGRIVSAASGTGSGGGSGSSTTFVSTVSGSPSSTITISGLDLSADKSYSCSFAVKDASGTSAVLSVLFNGDSSIADYERQNIIFTGGSIFPGRQNSPYIAQFSPSTQMMGTLTVFNDFDGKTRALISINNGAVASLTRVDSALAWNASANMTSLTIASSGTNGFAVGSTASCWKTHN